jgi:hypothetical protein
VIIPALRLLSVPRARISNEFFWHVVLMAAFTLGTGRTLASVILVPPILGSHATIYTGAARAWLAGGDPWSVGPPIVIFAGPPTMLLPFAAFTRLPDSAVAFISVVGAAAIALWSIRRLGLPTYWLLFPPLSGSILLGHPEVLVLALLVLGGPLSGLAAIIKPYAAFALLAERRWQAMGVAVAAVVVTAPFLPWTRFLDELSTISANLSRQAQGDSAFGNPLLMLVAFAALARIGLRRALWLATPVLWPYAQVIYRVGSIPALSPLIAACWALPIPGSALAGIVLEAVALQIGHWWRLPLLIQAGIDASHLAPTERLTLAPEAA